MRPAMLLAAAVWLAIPAGAVGQTATPPPPKSKDAPTAKDAIDLTTTITSATINGGMAVNSGVDPSLTTRLGTYKINKRIDMVGNASAVIGAAASGYEVGSEIAKGNYAEAARKGAAATINTCVDRGIDVGCRAATLYFNGPASVYTSPLCVAAVQIVKTCAEKLTDTTLGDAVVKYGEIAGRAAVGAYDEFQRNLDAKRADAANRMANMRSANETALAEQEAARIADQQATAADGYDAMMYANMLQGFAAAMPPPSSAPMAPMAPPPPVPMAAPPARPVPAPSAAPVVRPPPVTPPPLAAPANPPRSYAGVTPPQSRIGPPLPSLPSSGSATRPCHSGHNETRHPGGCHSAPLGSTN